MMALQTYRTTVENYPDIRIYTKIPLIIAFNGMAQNYKTVIQKL